MAVEQYPFEGFTDIYPPTRTTPDWFGFGHKHLEQRSSPVKHIVLADGQRHSVLEVRHDKSNGYVEGQVMEHLKGQQSESPHIRIDQSLSHWRTPPREPRGEEPMFQFPDSHPTRRHIPKGRGWGTNGGF